MWIHFTSDQHGNPGYANISTGQTMTAVEDIGSGTWYVAAFSTPITLHSGYTTQADAVAAIAALVACVGVVSL